MKLNALTIVSVLILSSCQMKTKPLVIGHRGAMGYETENTLASVQKALDMQVDMIEIDVFNIASGETVVFHDERLERLSNAGGNIETYNIVDLNKVVLEGNHQIPKLQDVLKLIDNKVGLNIELKGAGTSDRVNFITNYYIKNKGWEAKNILISSFNWDELREMRRLNPDIAIAILTEEDPLKAIPIAKELNAVAINPYFKKLTLEKVKAIQNEGLKVYTWTVNEPADITTMEDFGVDGIITNYPDRVN